MIKYCCIDCETIPNSTLPKGVKPEFDPDIVKTGAMGSEKAQEKIDKAKVEFDETLDKKMSLDPDLCEVVCFAFRTIDDAWTYGHNQPCLVCDAWDVIKKQYLDHIPLVSFNGIGFDLPVLLHAALKHNIPVSPQMYSDLTRKYSTRYHIDLLQWFSSWDKTRYKSLDFYLKLFNIGQKSGDGSEIYGWWRAGEYEKIRFHCEEDVRLTAKLFERVAPWIIENETI